MGTPEGSNGGPRDTRQLVKEVSDFSWEIEGTLERYNQYHWNTDDHHQVSTGDRSYRSRYFFPAETRTERVVVTLDVSSQ